MWHNEHYWVAKEEEIKNTLLDGGEQRKLPGHNTWIGSSPSKSDKKEVIFYYDFDLHFFND